VMVARWSDEAKVNAIIGGVMDALEAPAPGGEALSVAEESGAR